MISGFFAVRSSGRGLASWSQVGPRAAGCGGRVGSKKRVGIVEGLGLRVLAQADEGRAAVGRDRASSPTACGSDCR